MSAALTELARVAATSRDAHVYSCFSHAQTAILYAERGSLGMTLESLTHAELAAVRLQGSCNDWRAVSVMRHVREDCRVALTVKLT